MYSADLHNYPLIIDLSRLLTDGAAGSHGTLSYSPHRYPFIILGEEERRGTNFLHRKKKKKSSGRDSKHISKCSPQFTKAGLTSYTCILYSLWNKRVSRGPNVDAIIMWRAGNKALHTKNKHGVVCRYQISSCMTKQTKRALRQAKPQISLGI